MPPKVFERRGVAQGRVKIQNTGDVPTTFGVRVTPGVLTLTGFSAQVNPAAVTTVITPRPVQPGETAEITVFVRLPDIPGDKTFEIQVGETDASGRLIRIFDTERFPGLASVMEVILVPPPGDRGLLPELTTQERAMDFKDAVSIPSLELAPTEATPGQRIEGAVTVPTGASFPFRVQVRIVLLDSNGAVEQTLETRDLNLGVGQTINQGFTINTSALAPGQYGIGVSLFDPVTNASLLDRFDFSRVLTILGVIEPPSIPELDLLPELPELPTGVWQAGDLTVSAFQTVQVQAGDSFNLIFNVENPARKVLPATITIEIIDPQGISGAGPLLTYVPSGNATDAVSHFTRTPANAPLGTYGLNVTIMDPTGLTIVSQRLSNVFTVSATAVGPTPTPTPAPTPAPTPTALAVTLGSISPRRVTAGDTVRFGIPLTSTAAASLGATVNVLDPSGRIAPGGSLSEDTFSVRAGTPFILNKSWNVPGTTPAGSYSLSIRVWDPSTIRTVGFLIDQRVSNVFNVTVPSPVTTPARLVASGAASLRPLTVLQGGTLTGMWGVRNIGGTRGRANLFLDGPGGGSSAAVDVDPGEQETLEIARTVPSSQRTGTVTYGLALRDSSTRRSIDVEVFRIEVVASEPEPTPVAPPAALTLEPGRFQLSLPLTATPRFIRRGQGVTISGTLENFVNVAANVSVTILTRGPDGRAHGTGQGVVMMPANGSKLMVITVPIDRDAPSGSYGVQVLVTQTTLPFPGPAPALVNATVEGVFQVS